MKKLLIPLAAIGLLAIAYGIVRNARAQIASGYDALNQIDNARNFGFSAPARDQIATNLGYRILGPTAGVSGVAPAGPPVIMVGAYSPYTNTSLTGKKGWLFLNTLGGATNTLWVYENATDGLTNGWVNK